MRVARPRRIISDVCKARSFNRAPVYLLSPKSAERAAGEFLSGGNLWVAGRQADFIAEACQRAGGLMAIAPLGRHVPATHDVILYAVPGSLDDNDQGNYFENCRGKGRQCGNQLLFSNGSLPKINILLTQLMVNVVEL